ncbi:restriction endonuclease subunit S [Holdemanella biformis]|uniref:restriction endonuclease subunit S n=1 Tax=Holdemanella biformis TaxID=1735 RepID=UPI0022E7510B|nr:restriction endonuclease subunit S [Holdemanella biformis]
MENRMTAQQLKNSILQMAVQGKLVSQDPNDEPASVLLERIRKEKEQLIKDGKIKKNKKESYIFRGADNLHYEQIGKEVRCIEDELPFEIPDTWQWVKLGYISTYEQTKEKIKATLAEPNLWELNLEDIEKGGRILQKKTVRQCNSKGDKIIFKKGDILYSKLRPYLLKILIADEAGICTSEIVPFHTYNEISSDYMVTVLKSPFIDNYINSVTYGVKMPRAGTDTMINLFIPLPPVKEQNRIIECIHSLNPLIQKYQKAEEQLYELNSSIKEQLKKSILQYAIEGKLVPQDPNDEPASVLLERIRKEKQKLIAEGKIKKDKNESIIYRRDNSYYEKQNRIEQCIDDEITFEIPDTWEWCRFNQLFKLTSGQDLSTDKFNSACKGIPYITGASNLENGSVIINRWTTEPKSFAYSGDLLLTCKGTIGKIAFLTVEKAHIARQIMSIASPYKINLHYIKLILNLNIINLKAKAKSMIPGISRDDVLSILIPVPPLNEQDRIVLKLQELKL